MRHDSKFGYLKYSTSAFKQISELFLQITDNFKKKVNCGNLDSIETGDGFRMQLSRQPSFWGEIHSQGELFGAMGSDIMMQSTRRHSKGSGCSGRAGQRGPRPEFQDPPPGALRAVYAPRRTFGRGPLPKAQEAASVACTSGTFLSRFQCSLQLC